MNSGTLRNADKPLKAIFTEWNGTRWVITCPYFIRIGNKEEYKCLTFDHTTDKIRCGKYPRKTRPYRIRSAYICWLHALSHRYARKVDGESFLPFSPLKQPSVLPLGESHTEIKIE